MGKCAQGWVSTDEAFGECAETTGKPVSMVNSSPEATDIASGKEKAIRKGLDYTMARTRIDKAIPKNFVLLLCSNKSTPPISGVYRY